MSKRRGNCSSSNEEKKTCTNSRKKGDQTHFSGTGIVVRNKDEVTTSILTSANVIRCFDDDSKINPFLDIRVLLPNKQRVIGWMGHFDLNYNIAVVVIKYLPGLRAASFDHEVRFGSQSKVVAVGRSFNSGKLMALSGIVTDGPTDYPEHLMISTCKITKDMAGGPLIDLDGNFVGMNFFSEERTPFLPRNKIYRSLVRSCTLWVEIDDECTSIIERCRSKMIHNNFVGTSRGVAKKRNQEQTVSITSFSEGTSDEENESETQKLPEYSTSDSEDFWEEELFPELIKPLPDDEFTQLLKKDLKSRNYPMPIRFWGGMRLKNTFEEEFAEDTWCKLSKKVALNTSQSVVSLASFKGEERFFACTGVFIDFNGSTSRVVTSASLVRISADENKIADNLKIKVYLPNKRIAVGELQHCNLSYNIAVVSVKGFCCLRTAELDKQMQIEPHREVVAIGRIFESGKLMATSGILSDEESKLDCRELMISTCKITKAGIGGPLIDFDGNFVGINFYGTKETHYLPRLMIQRLLKDFDG
ncbi:uncharacterized protein [Oryza sativa Japonica Group]|uniref:uncharacterized protein n=1 Tax=Oryza sativa subsp. japonica TaxID=39947 RepID=UPI00339C0E4F